MEFDKTLTYDLTQLAIVYRTYLEKSMNEIGLHSGQVFILVSLWKDDGQSQIALVKNLKLAPPTINKMVKSLMNGGFVKCQKCETDSRMMRVYLTDKGREIREAVAEQWNKLETQFYSNLTETEKLILSQLSIKLKENLGKNIAVVSKDL